jgi:hypothetical protein
MPTYTLPSSGSQAGSHPVVPGSLRGIGGADLSGLLLAHREPISRLHSGEEGIVLKLFGYGLLDPDGVHAHDREDCPRVRRLHPGELRVGLTAIRSHCPCCSDIAARKKSRISQD